MDKTLFNAIIVIAVCLILYSLPGFVFLFKMSPKCYCSAEKAYIVDQWWGDEKAIDPSTCQEHLECRQPEYFFHTILRNKFGLGFFFFGLLGFVVAFLFRPSKG
jgi:hypothetical protein